MSVNAKDIPLYGGGYEIKSLLHGSYLSYLVGFYLFAFYLDLHLRIPALQAIRFQFTYGAIVGFFCLRSYLSDKNKQINFNLVTKTALMLLSILCLYTIFTMDPDESTKTFIDRALKFSVVSFFIYCATNKIEDLRVIIAFILLAWLKMGEEGFVGWYTGALVWENQGIPRLHGSTGMYGHPNSFSGFAVGCLPYTVFLFLCVKSNLIRLALAGLFACSLLIIVFTGSRTGYLAVLFGSSYFFLSLKTGKFKIVIFMLVAFALFGSLIPTAYQERFESIFTGKAKEGHSSERRLEIIDDALIIYKAYPMGLGVQAFPKVREQMFGRSQNTHSLYLEVLTNIGPIGFLVFSIFVYQLIRLNVENIKVLAQNQHQSLNTKLLINLSKATIGFILMRLLLGIFGMDLYEIYWWIALGMVLAIKKLIHNDKIV